MIENLPIPVDRYFSGKNSRDFATAVSGFSRSAVVVDEGRRHVGPDAIRAWMTATAAAYDDRSEVLGVTATGAGVEVSARVSGTFAGSPITLRFGFTLDGDGITGLEISA